MIVVQTGARRRARNFVFALALLAATVVLNDPALSQTIVFVPTSLPPGTQGVPYNQMVLANDSDGDDVPGPFDNDDVFTYSVVAGALPPGVALNFFNGNISGTPTAGGSYSFTVRATDLNNSTGDQSYTLNIGTSSLTLLPSSLPAATRGATYNQTVSASGGTGPYTYSVSSGALPAGLSLNPSTGALTGIPTGSGPANFTIQALDSAGNVGSQAYAINVGSNSLTVNPATLPAATQNVAYNQSVSASGGSGPYTYTVMTGTLPTGLALNPNTGAITGTPTGSGQSVFTIQATDSAGNTGSRGYAVTVGTNSLTVNPATLPAATQNVAYNQSVSASGGSGPYTYTVTTGTLPTGLALNPNTGAITGTPTGSGPSVFTIQATDSIGNTGSRGYTVNVGTNSLTLNPTTLPPAPQGTPYRQTVTASGGTAPYTYAVIAGALPPWLSLNVATGDITGTPSAIGNYSFTLQARDINGNTGSRAFTVGTARRDPTLDPDVRALVAAQAAAARRFANSQVTNVMRHLETLHDDFDPCGVAVDVGVSVRSPLPAFVDPFEQPSAAPFPNDPSPAAQVARRSPNPEECGKNRWWVPSIAFWAGGSIEFGSASANGATSDSRFSTSGLTSGVDARLRDDLIVGGAIGYGADRSDIGQSGTRSDARSFSGMAYASYRPAASWFIDATMGFAYLGFDNSRWVALDSTLVSGNRAGGSFFSSVALTREFKSAGWTIAPYARADFVTATLGDYAEQGASNQALTYGATSFTSTAAVLGLRTSYDMAMDWGVLTPNLRLEYKHALDGALSQTMSYTDLGSSSPNYTLALDALSHDLLGATIGLRARTGSGLTMDFEYGAIGGASSTLTQSVRASVRLAY